MERSRAWTALTLCALSHLTAKAFTFRIALGELDNTNQDHSKRLLSKGSTSVAMASGLPALNGSTVRLNAFRIRPEIVFGASYPREASDTSAFANKKPASSQGG